LSFYDLGTQLTSYGAFIVTPLLTLVTLLAYLGIDYRKKSDNLLNETEEIFMVLRSVIWAREIIPNIVKLVEYVYNKRMDNPHLTVEEAVSDAESKGDISGFLSSLFDAVTLYDKIYTYWRSFPRRCGAVGNTMLILAVYIVISLVLVSFIYLKSLFNYLEYLFIASFPTIPIVILGGSIIALFMLYNLLKFTSEKKFFYEKDREYQQSPPIIGGGS